MTRERVKAVWRRGVAAAGVALTLTALPGCGFGGLYNVTLPGGADVGDDPYRVSVEFADVLDLVPQSAVRVNDVAVGRVDRIDLDGWHAKVTLLVNRKVTLPANARAELRQTSLLGEKYVSLAGPQTAPPQGRLSDGDVIPLARTGRNPEVEEVLSALSMLLNGGGLEQLQAINRELGDALEGRETQVRDLLAQLDTFVGGLDDQKSQITRAIDSLDRLTATLARQRQVIGSALDTLPGGLRVLAEQRQQLTTMLTSLQELGRVGTQVINASGQNIAADLRALQPTLTQLAAAGDDLPAALELLLTYPFPRTSVDGIRGDYTNLFVTVDLDVTDVLDNLLTDGQGNPDPPGLPPIITVPGEPGVGGLPGLPQIPGLPNDALPGLPVNPDQPAVPGLPTPPGAPGGGLPDLLSILLGGGGP